MIATQPFVDHPMSWNDIQAFRNDQLNFLWRITQAHGKRVHFSMMGMDIYHIACADCIQPLLLEQVDKLHRETYTRKMFRRMMGEGILVAEDEAWKYQRKMMQPAFHAQRIGAYADTMVNFTGDMLNTWETDTVLLIHEAFSELTQRIIVQTMFNRDMHDFTAQFGEEMHTILRIGESQIGALPIPDWMPTLPRIKQQNARDKILAWIDEIIAEQMNTPQDYGDLLSMLLATHDEQGNTLTHQQIQDECMTLFIAGHETTAVTLTWAFYLLAQHPDMYAKLQQEVDSVLGDALPTLESVRQLPYTEQVIKETLRLYPPAWSFARIALEDVHIEDTVIPEGSTLFFNTYAMHRQTDYFDAPDHFMPERFDNPTHPRYAYLPFGAGRRTCIGNQFAMLEATLLLSHITQHYHLSLVDNTVIPEPMITLRPKGGLRMKIEKR